MVHEQVDKKLQTILQEAKDNDSTVEWCILRALAELIVLTERTNGLTLTPVVTADAEDAGKEAPAPGTIQGVQAKRGWLSRK